MYDVRDLPTFENAGVEYLGGEPAEPVDMTEDEGTGAAQFGGVAGNALVNFYSTRTRPLLLVYHTQNHLLIILTKLDSVVSTVRY